MNFCIEGYIGRLEDYMITMKFGGTSVGDADRIRNVVEIIKSRKDKKLIVVVSAVSKVTDMLITLAVECSKGNGKETLKKIIEKHNQMLEALSIEKSIIDTDIKELNKLAEELMKSKKLDIKVMDSMQSFGERMSSKIVAACLRNSGLKAEAFDSWELGLTTNKDFGNAEPLEDSYSRIKNNIKKLKVIPVITGFIGKTREGEMTTLGRGGSDYTAAIFGSAAECEEIQIWTDVNGIMSTDPKIVQSARTIEKISFAEASELAYFGAKVIHPKTLLPAMKKNIPVRVLNSFEPSNKGTLIVNKAAKSKDIVKAIACKKKINLVHVESTRMLGAYGFLARIFDVFNEFKKSVDVVSTSEVSVSITVDNEENLDVILNRLKEIGDAKVSSNRAIVCVVGEGIGYTPGVAARTFTAMAKNNINIEMMSVGASDINITFIVKEEEAEKAVNSLHKEYFGG